MSGTAILNEETFIETEEKVMLSLEITTQEVAQIFSN